MKTKKAGIVRGKAMTGVIYAEDGSIARVRLNMKRGQWNVAAADSWPLANMLKTTLRLSGGTVLGLRSEWRRSATDPALEPSAAGNDKDINAYARPAEIGFLLDAMSGSITSLVTEDSFLLTLPLAFCVNPAPSSFLSIYSESGITMLGVVTAGKLEAVFSFPYSTASSAEASVGRVRRYWAHTLKRDDFPRKAVVFNPNDSQKGNFDGLEPEPFALPEELRVGSAAKAAGAALAPLYAAPTFKLPPRYVFRKLRPLLHTFSTVLLCASVIITMMSCFINFQAAQKLAYREKTYLSRLNDNKTLQDLNQTADELSTRILSINKAYTQAANWGNLLLLLGEIKPDDLFLDKLGSDNVQGTENSVRLALSGWAETETSVTELISGLQASSYINNVSLSSMERGNRDKNICRFRILCTMQLSKD